MFLCDDALGVAHMDCDGVAPCLATISVVLATVVFAGENVRTGPMRFIERYLCFSPGDGSMEILVAVVLVAIVAVGAFRLATK